MSATAPSATKRQQYDPARAAYQRSRNAEIWVKTYLDKMNAWPGPQREPDYTELVESIGARRAAQSMRQYFHDQADLPQPNGPMARP